MKTILVNYTGRTAAGPVYAYEMTKALVENGATVYAIISKQVDNIADWKTLPINLFLIDTYSNKYEFILRTLKFIFYERYCLKNKLSAVSFDAIYVPMCTYWSFLISNLLENVPVYYTVHDPIPHSGENILNRIYQYVYIYEARKAYKIIILSKKFTKIVMERFKRNVEDVLYIPHGAFFSYMSNANHATNLLEYSAKRTNFLFFGRIEKYKGLPVLLKAYKALEERFKDKVSLTIAGKGDITAYKEDIAKLKNITILNYLIPNNSVASLFAGKKIVTVLPYIDATQSGVVPTAYMFNSLVMASNTGALSEQVGNGKYGVLFLPNDERALEKAMIDVVDNYDLYHDRIVAARRYVASLDWGKLGKILLNDMY